MAETFTLCIMRHGMAENHAPRDSLRELVEFGETQIQATATWFSKTFPRRGIDLAFVSPYIRAKQSFDIFSKRIRVDSSEELTDITPNGDARLVHDYCVSRHSMMAGNASKLSSILLVSHMPLVSLLVEEICPDTRHSLFNTGSMAVIDYDLQQAKGNLIHHFQGVF